MSATKKLEYLLEQYAVALVDAPAAAGECWREVMLEVDLLKIWCRQRGASIQPNTCLFCKCPAREERMVTRDRRCAGLPWQVACSCGATGPHAETPEGAVIKWNGD